MGLKPLCWRRDLWFLTIAEAFVVHDTDDDYVNDGDDDENGDFNDDVITDSDDDSLHSWNKPLFFKRNNRMKILLTMGSWTVGTTDADEVSN